MPDPGGEQLPRPVRFAWRMSIVHFVDPSEGERCSAGPSINRILEDGTRTQQRLGVIEVQLAPGWPGPPPHVHRAHEETFYVVSGAVRFTSGTTVRVLEPGGLCTVPVDAPHGFGNASELEPAVVLLTVSPQRYVEYFRELHDLQPTAAGTLDPGEVGALMARYATDVVPS